MKTKLSFSPPVIAQAKAAEAPYRLWDTKVPGLFLRVQPSGAKTYNVQWTHSSSKSIGKHPVMTVDAARKQALAILADAAANGTPSVVRDRAKPAIEIHTFGDFMRERYGPHIEATAKAGKMTVHCIASQFGHLYDRSLASIQRLDFDEFKAKRLKAGLHPSTVNRDMDRLKAAL